MNAGPQRRMHIWEIRKQSNAKPEVRLLQGGTCDIGSGIRAQGRRAAIPTAAPHAPNRTARRGGREIIPFRNIPALVEGSEITRRTGVGTHWRQIVFPRKVNAILRHRENAIVKVRLIWR